MSYIGNEPTVGQWRKLTDISGSFNGVTTSFTTSVPPGTSDYYVTAGSANQLIISLNDVIQEPGVDYTVSTNTITFAVAPASGLSFFGILCGDALNIGVPSDGTVTASKLTSNLSIDLTSGSAATPSLTFDANTGLFSAGEDIVAISTGGTERIRFAASGQLGLAGANYGTSGQFLTSNGSSAAPTWTSGVKLDVAQTFTAGQRGEITALTDGATITPDFADSNHFSVTLGGNRTLANPTNLTAGQSGCIWITQDGTGSRTLAYGSYWDFSGGTAPTLTTTASARDCLVYSVQSTTQITATLITNLS